MNWYGRVGEIRESFRSASAICFRWRISDIFSMPENAGVVHFSPEITFLEDDWYLGIYKNDEDETQEWIGIELWRSYHTISHEPILFSLGVRKKDGIEERIHRNREFPKKGRLCSMSKFLQKYHLQNRKSELAPYDTLTISCTLWRSDPLTNADQWFYSSLSRSDNLTANSNQEEEYEFVDSKGSREPDSREPRTGDVKDSDSVGLKRDNPRRKGKKRAHKRIQTEDLQDAGTTNEEFMHHDKAEKTLISRETQTEDVPHSSSKDDGLDLKGKTLASHETQTEDTLDIAKQLDLEDVSTLRKDYRALLHSADDHDLIFKIQDHEFRAHKNILRRRCPRFLDVVLKKMTESTDGTIAIDDCEKHVFDEFFDYVYTGMVEEMTPENVMGLYYASDKYDMPTLKARCIHFLKASMPTNMICDIILLATRSGQSELLEQATTFFSEHLEEILATDEWARFNAGNPLLGTELVRKAVRTLLHKN